MSENNPAEIGFENHNLQLSNLISDQLKKLESDPESKFQIILIGPTPVSSVTNLPESLALPKLLETLHRLDLLYTEKVAVTSSQKTGYIQMLLTQSLKNEESIRKITESLFSINSQQFNIIFDSKSKSFGVVIAASTDTRIVAENTNEIKNLDLVNFFVLFFRDRDSSTPLVKVFTLDGDSSDLPFIDIEKSLKQISEKLEKDLSIEDPIVKKFLISKIVEKMFKGEIFKNGYSLEELIQVCNEIIEKLSKVASENYVVLSRAVKIYQEMSTI